MRIKSIELQNFRCYKSSTVPFHPQFTLISASNGQGKTTLLQAIALSMGALLRSVAEYNIPGIAQSDVRLKNISSGKRTVLEKQFPCTISAEADLEPYGSSEAGWEISLDSAKGRTRYSSAQPATTVSQTIDQSLRDGDPDLILPIISFYGAGRIFTQHRSKKISVFSSYNRRNGYIDCLDSAANDKLLMEWFQKMDRISYETKEEQCEFTAVKEAITAAYEHLSGRRVKHLIYNFDQNVLEFCYTTTEKPEEEMIELSSMWSAGYKSLLTMVADIAFRMANLNPHLEDKVTALTPGIVLIDEIDIHLHPAWQKTVVSLLTELFPSVQFIATTHAPAVIQSVKQDQLILLDHASAVHPDTQSYGNDINLILKNIMGTDERPTEIQNLFTEASKSISCGRFDEAEELLNRLAMKIGPNDQRLVQEQTSLAVEREWAESDD